MPNKDNSRFKFWRTIFVGGLFGLAVGVILALLVAANVFSFGAPIWFVLVASSIGGVAISALGWMLDQISRVFSTQAQPIPAAQAEAFALAVVPELAVGDAFDKAFMSEVADSVVSMRQNDALNVVLQSLQLVFGGCEDARTIRLPAQCVQFSFFFALEEDLNRAIALTQEQKLEGVSASSHYNGVFVLALEGISAQEYRAFKTALQIDSDEHGPDKITELQVPQLGRNPSPMLRQSKNALLNAVDTCVSEMKDDVVIDQAFLMDQLQLQLGIDQFDMTACFNIEREDISDDDWMDVHVVGVRSFAGTEAACIHRANACLLEKMFTIDPGEEMDLILVGKVVGIFISQLHQSLGGVFAGMPLPSDYMQRIFFSGTDCELGRESNKVLTRIDQVKNLEGYLTQLLQVSMVKEGEESGPVLKKLKAHLAALHESQSCCPGMNDLMSRPWDTLADILDVTSMPGEGGGKGAIDPLMALRRFQGEVKGGLEEIAGLRPCLLAVLDVLPNAVPNEDCLGFALDLLGFLQQFRTMLDGVCKQRGLSGQNEAVPADYQKACVAWLVSTFEATRDASQELEPDIPQDLMPMVGDVALPPI